jgi:hypothetical protein
MEEINKKHSNVNSWLAEKPDLNIIPTFIESGYVQAIKLFLDKTEDIPEKIAADIKYLTYHARICKDYRSAVDAAEKGEIRRKTHYTNEIKKSSLESGIAADGIINHIKTIKKIKEPVGCLSSNLPDIIEEELGIILND